MTNNRVEGQNMTTGGKIYPAHQRDRKKVMNDLVLSPIKWKQSFQFTLSMTTDNECKLPNLIFNT